MKIKATLTIINSRRDRAGNCYWAFEYLDHKTGKVVRGLTVGGESNILAIRLGWSKPKEWDRSVRTESKEIGIREYDKLRKEWSYAGCDPADIAAFIRKGLKTQD